MKHASQGLVHRIEGYEGFVSCPYLDRIASPPVWTVGYGETQGVTAATPCLAQPVAERKLRRRLRRDYEPYIHRLGIPLTQHQFDALLSAIYNLGPGVLDAGRSLGDALRSSQANYAAWIKRVQDAIRLYDKAGSPPRPVAGLTRRRHEEAALFALAGKRDKRLVKARAQLAKVKLALADDRKRKARIEATIKRLERRHGGK